jgi:hypothetical protein
MPGFQPQQFTGQSVSDTSPASALDPASRRTIKRFLLSASLTFCWFSIFRTQMDASALALTLVLAATWSGILALACDDRPFGSVLNRWDEAAAFTDLAALVHAVV